MNSRERVLQSIRHKQPDRVPLDIGATPSSGISAVAYDNLKKYLKIEGGATRVFDVVQQVVRPEECIKEMFGVDTIDLGEAYNQKEEDWYDIKLGRDFTVQYPSWFHPVKNPKGDYEAYNQDGLLIAKMPVGATFFDQQYFPYGDDYPDSYEKLDVEMDRVLWQKLATSPWDHASCPDFYADLRRKALELRASSDRAIVLSVGCNLFEWGTFLRRIDNFLMDIYSEPEEVDRLLDQLLERHMASLQKVCEAVGDIVDIAKFGDDLGMDTGMFMSREKYQTHFKKGHKMMCDYVHNHSNMHTMLHSCGSIYPIMGDLIEAGFEIINPIQTTARQMDPEILKREFGKDVTFWGGGCNTRSILNRGSAGQVYDYTRRMLEIFMKDGGYVFNQEHNIMPDVPPENIVAMYRAVREFM